MNNEVAVDEITVEIADENKAVQFLKFSDDIGIQKV